MKTSVIFTSTAEHLSKNLQRKASGGAEFIFPEKNKEGKRSFPDGEIYMRLPAVKDLKGKRVVVLHSGAPNPNDGLMELKMILQILKDHDIKAELFFTYFPYGQQDKIFQHGETNVAESLIKKLHSYYKVKKIYVVDPHFGKNDWIEKYRLISISSVPFLMKKAQEEFGQKILFLSPDQGGKRRTGISGFKKKRIDSFRVETFSPEMDIKNEVVGIIDDILETGGTLVKTHEIIKQSGVKNVLALITHGLLNTGIKRVKEKFSKLYLTNSIDRKGANVDIADLIIETFGFLK